jgi:predicted S18 family serine protease
VNLTNASQDNFALAKDALDDNSYYSAASFCFSGNVKLAYKSMENMSNEDLKLIYAKLLGNISEFESGLDNMAGSLSTISELETYMIVAERLSESKNTLSDIDPDNISAYDLAYAFERFGTAVVWSEFSRLPGQKFVMDDDLLMIACTKKLSEAEERLNYLELYYPKTYIRDELDDAYTYYHNTDYALCIFKASKVKADSNILLSAIFVPEEDMVRLLDAKLNAARNAILKQSKSNVFPILGYSYYEYADVLREDDLYSALLYSEYALELSNIDMYFKKKESVILPTPSFFSGAGVYLFLLGVCIGVLLTIIVVVILIWIKHPKKHATKAVKIKKK